MRIGTVREIKTREYRVGLTPGSVQQLVADGHDVLVEAGCGTAIGIDDDQYDEAGATLVDSAEAVFALADLIVKVKEPQPGEVRLLRPGQILFTYLHLAADLQLARGLLDSGVTGVAYETVTDPQGRLPLLAPMSEVAGRLSIQAGAHALEMAQGGAGVLLGGIPGVAPAKIVIVGGGVVGANAALMAVGAQADVTILDRSLDRLRQLEREFGGRARLLFSDPATIQAQVTAADLVIGAVLVPGAAAPKLITREMVRAMRRGSVIVDVAIDQGGATETSRPTTHDEPTYVVDGVVHYCVANMPGAVPRTSTFGLNNATLPYVRRIAASGLTAIAEDPDLRRGLNVHRGRLTLPEIAGELGVASVAAEAALAA